MPLGGKENNIFSANKCTSLSIPQTRCILAKEVIYWEGMGMLVKPKAIFLDMDGTILNHLNLVSIHTKETIDQLREQGIFVFIATGRSFDEIEDVVPEGFQVDGYITSNGMAGYVDNEILFEHSLSVHLVRTVIEKARASKVYYELFPYGASRFTLNQDREYVEEKIRDPKPEDVGINEWLSRKQAIKEEIAWCEDIVGNKFSKFYFFARTKEEINSWKEELDLLKAEMDFSTASSTAYNVELMVANVNKATGIQAMLERFNLTAEETMAIGDSNNDIQMLQLVKYPVAMQNATDYIKNMAWEITDLTCDEDGVSKYLKEKFGI